MYILTIRTDKPEAELGLFNNDQQLAYTKWMAHKQLATTIHSKIEQLLSKQKLKLTSLNAIAVYKGPGSFTGLRIGITVANALAYSLNIPIVSNGSDDWLKKSLDRLLAGENETISLPEYGMEPHITKQIH